MRSPFDKPFGLRSPFGPQSGALSEAAALLATWADSNGGLAADFTDITATQTYGSMKIIDGATPANNWQTTSALTPFDKLTWTGASLRMCYGSDGVLRYAPHNLFRRSQEIDNADWTKQEVSVAANDAVAPDGTTTADKITDTSATSIHRFYGQLNTFTTGERYQFSIYLKYGNHRWVGLRADYPAIFASFDLQNGVVGSVDAAASSSMTAVGNGWYRCSISWTTTAGGSANCVVQFANSDTTADSSFAGTGSAYFHAWGAQLQRTPVHSTDYIATTSSAVYKPRIDYDPSTLAVRGLLVEEARTNLALQSQTFGTTWVVSTATITADQIAAPDGTTTADLWTATATGYPSVYQTITVVASTQYTFSMYVKAGNQTKLSIELRYAIGDDVDPDAFFTLSGSGTVDSTDTGTSATITSVGNGWYRVTATKTNPSTGTNCIVIIGAATDAAGSTVNGATHYLWGAQLEAGSFPTSYIPTTSASVTRAADAVSIATTLFNYGATANTFYGYIGAIPFATLATNRIICAQNANTPLQINSETSVSWYDGTTFAAATVPSMKTNAVKAAFADDASSTGIVGNGGTVVTTAAGSLGLTTMYLGSNAGAGSFLNGHIRQVMHLPQRLSNANLQTLTT